MTIKKQYVDLITFLEENKKETVESILKEAIQMCLSKVNTKTHVKDTDGEVFAIFCYYHKQWELVSNVEYGKKANSTTGLNTMCKQGVRGWTRQQKLFSNLESDIMKQMMKI